MSTTLADVETSMPADISEAIARDQLINHGKTVVGRLDAMLMTHPDILSGDAIEGVSAGPDSVIVIDHAIASDHSAWKNKDIADAIAGLYMLAKNSVANPNDIIQRDEEIFSLNQRLSEAEKRADQAEAQIASLNFSKERIEALEEEIAMLRREADNRTATISVAYNKIDMLERTVRVVEKALDARRY